MLRKGFLGGISDWVSGRISSGPRAFEKAQEVFGLHKYLDTSTDPEKVIGLFSEWLVFDHKQKIFDGGTGLEYFVRYNPLHLSAEDLGAYKNMLDFEVGLFEVKSVEQGRGVTLESITSGSTHFVHDINASLTLRPNETIWTRIAPVLGTYHMVGSIFFSVPIKIMGGLRGAMSEWPKNSFDAREIASWRFSNPSSPRQLSGAIRDIVSGTQRLTYEQAEKKFIEALKKSGMSKMFSVETYKKWATDNKKYPLGFSAGAIMTLMPTDVSSKDARSLIEASMNFANTLPRKALKGKTPNEAILDTAYDDERLVEMDVYSKEKYVKKAEQAGILMREGKFQEAYKMYEEDAKDMLRDKAPVFDSFRIYANAAICCCHQGKFELGQELLNAALRINPLYDFAIRSKWRYVDAINADISACPKSDKKFLLRMIEQEKIDGVKKYRRTAFRRYEDFLNDIGVTLEYKTVTAHSAFIRGKDGVTKDIGGNDKCYCGSGKKFKHCCGK